MCRPVVLRLGKDIWLMFEFQSAGELVEICFHTSSLLPGVTAHDTGVLAGPSLRVGAQLALLFSSSSDFLVIIAPCMDTSRL